MRIYLPATLDELDASELPPRRGHAVTAALRAALPDEDDEGLEFAAQLMAADDSLDLIRASEAAPRLRLVVSVDLPDARVTTVEDAEDGAPSLVEIVGTVAAADIACVHVDEPGAAADVGATVAGDDEAGERLDDADLLWYDASELAAIPR
ncbi:hypothetical protein [Cellulomonas sp. PhB150]|uniref:DUF6912 family protein n=1 Tax=Cellulomonas sp. PhB150 TaxID=2485188 RepID=UPI000F47A1ED|nr:hypothetical protein [Cellulomonas sp. PhB150]ROS31169.1 hypothetical protein EDF34_0824 [Cellulomonas sp. PhB150]